MTDRSPWWYRLRGLLFALMFVVGFVGGWTVWSLAGKTYHVSPLGMSIGTFLVFCCFALRAWGSAYLHADVVWNPDAQTGTLVVAGPFRFTRSPLYLGNLCMSLGIGLLAPPPGFAFIVAGTLAVVLLLVRYETEQLHRHFGTLVDAYVKAVPALLPRLTPANVIGSADPAPSVAQGLRSEIFTGSLTAGMIALMIFGDRAMPAITAVWICSWIVQQVATWNRIPNATPPEP